MIRKMEIIGAHMGELLAVSSNTFALRKEISTLGYHIRRKDACLQQGVERFNQLSCYIWITHVSSMFNILV